MNSSGVVTVQLGCAANYTGTHFWNLLFSNVTAPTHSRGRSEISQGLEDELRRVRSQLFWEPDEGPLAGQLVPRLILIECNDSVLASEHYVKPVISTIDPEDRIISPEVWSRRAERILWPGSERVHPFQQDRVAGRVQMADAYQFEKSILDWRDFQTFPLSNRSRTAIDALRREHPMAAEPLRKHDGHDNPNTTEMQQLRSWPRDLEGFREGLDLIHGGSVSEQLLDPIRYFAETCDVLRGIDLYASFELSENAGITAGLVEHLVDTFGANKSILVAGIDSNEGLVEKRIKGAWLDQSVDCTEAMLVSALNTSSSAGENDHVAYLPTRFHNLRNNQRERLWATDVPAVSFQDLYSCRFGWTAVIATALCANRLHVDALADMALGSAVREGSTFLRHRSVFELRACLWPDAWHVPGVQEGSLAQNFSRGRNLSTAGWYQTFVEQDMQMLVKQRLDGGLNRLSEDCQDSVPRTLQRYLRFLNNAQKCDSVEQRFLCGSSVETSLLLPHPFPLEIRKYALHDRQPKDLFGNAVPCLVCETTLNQSLETGADIQAWAASLWYRSYSPNRNPRDESWTQHEIEAAAEGLYLLADSYVPPDW
ncbi:hypothetical protein F1559_001121 [Cyanidiococcus yangmingshanensis]|uniref:Misato Segment II tubulin-like domain-containing protein n=1 Tax=Cyanidiococcus yangmingshanensis TaxID=2690220 RepID=A0A7J7IGL6_9RHOD|nr:hypothetical protein F1559_001121 [Cyanidiococcus yangmingshanensis]